MSDRIKVTEEDEPLKLSSRWIVCHGAFSGGFYIGAFLAAFYGMFSYGIGGLLGLPVFLGIGAVFGALGAPLAAALAPVLGFRHGDPVQLERQPLRAPFAAGAFLVAVMAGALVCSSLRSVPLPDSDARRFVSGYFLLFSILGSLSACVLPGISWHRGGRQLLGPVLFGVGTGMWSAGYFIEWGRGNGMGAFALVLSLVAPVGGGLGALFGVVSPRRVGGDRSADAVMTLLESRDRQARWDRYVGAGLLCLFVAVLALPFFLSGRLASAQVTGAEPQPVAASRAALVATLLFWSTCQFCLPFTLAARGAWHLRDLQRSRRLTGLAESQRTGAAILDGVALYTIRATLRRLPEVLVFWQLFDLGYRLWVLGTTGLSWGSPQQIAGILSMLAEIVLMALAFCYILQWAVLRIPGGNLPVRLLLTMVFVALILGLAVSPSRGLGPRLSGLPVHFLRLGLLGLLVAVFRRAARRTVEAAIPDEQWPPRG